MGALLRSKQIALKRSRSACRWWLGITSSKSDMEHFRIYLSLFEDFDNSVEYGTTLLFFQGSCITRPRTRLKSKGQTIAVKVGNEHQRLVKVDAIVDSVHMSRLQHTVEDLNLCNS